MIHLYNHIVHGQHFIMATKKSVLVTELSMDDTICIVFLNSKAMREIAMSTGKDVKNQTKQFKPFLTVEEACTYVGVSKSAMYKYMHRREIPYYKPNGKKAYFKPEDLDIWVFRNRVNSAEELRRRVDEGLQTRGNQKLFVNAISSGILNSEKL